jgi:hypothetical protein
VSQPSLPVGRTRLWDAQWRLIWDSATATTPAYQHVNTWVNATIDQPDGTRWAGQFYRCMEGVAREELIDSARTYLLEWPTLDGTRP